jgi:hypothetical protein
VRLRLDKPGKGSSAKREFSLLIAHTSASASVVSFETGSPPLDPLFQILGRISGKVLAPQIFHLGEELRLPKLRSWRSLHSS